MVGIRGICGSREGARAVRASGADERDGGAFDGWNHLDFVRSARRTRAILRSAAVPEAEVGDALPRRESGPALLDGRRAAAAASYGVRDTRRSGTSTSGSRPIILLTE